MKAWGSGLQVLELQGLNCYKPNHSTKLSSSSKVQGLNCKNYSRRPWTAVDRRKTGSRLPLVLRKCRSALQATRNLFIQSIRSTTQWFGRKLAKKLAVAGESSLLRFRPFLNLTLLLIPPFDSSKPSQSIPHFNLHI